MSQQVILRENALLPVTDGPKDIDSRHYKLPETVKAVNYSSPSNDFSWGFLSMWNEYVTWSPDSKVTLLHHRKGWILLS